MIYHYETKSPIEYRNFDWLQFIFNESLKNRKSIDLFREKPPAIITFNYDNLLEKSLFYFLVEHYGFDERDAIQYVNSLGILHAYGHLDSLITNSKKKIMAAYDRNIRVIGEDRETGSIADEIRQKLERPTRIYWLGFGFDQANTNLILDNSPTNDTRRVHLATNIGLTKRIRNRVHRRFKGIRFIKTEQVDSLHLISEIAPIFS